MKIGFIGLGIMGSRMATNLLAQDIDLIVYNRTTEKAQLLANQGAQVAQTMADFADVEILFTMLAHPEAITAVSTKYSFITHLLLLIFCIYNRRRRIRPFCDNKQKSGQLSAFSP